ncbi:MAG TPA: SDR family NAD(P)-dependent oxidoreductase [Verrucomicrobiae bacterium]|nr:SDR family NAD(P)-dependent oxidoreductase [Verrucomicrobiae bacterium]
MARVFITGSSDGLGRMAAQLLTEQGHNVVLHARNDQRGKEAMSQVPSAEAVTSGLAGVVGLLLAFWSKLVTAFFRVVRVFRPSRGSEGSTVGKKDSRNAA